MPYSHLFAHARIIASRRELAATLLAVLSACMLGGVFQIFSSISRFALWTVWLLMWWLIRSLSRGLNFKQLFRPLLPFYLWVLIYYLWGSLAGPKQGWHDAFLSTFYFTTICCSITVISATAKRWEFFCSAAQWMLVLNLLITLLLMSNSSILSLFSAHNFAHADTQLSEDRYSGLWGNANDAGMCCLMILVLSLWAKKSVAWVGRGCGIVLIYLTASRSSSYILLVLLLLYLIHLFSTNQRFRLALVGAVVAILLVFAIMPMDDLLTGLTGDEHIARILDVAETASQGSGHTRMEVVDNWLPYIQRVPWCGYGLNAMTGGGHGDVINRTDIPYLGVHDMYLGMIIDAGILGAIAFPAMLLFGLFRSMLVRLSQDNRLAVLSLWLIYILCSISHHLMLSGMCELMLFAVCAILAHSPALRGDSTIRMTRETIAGAGKRLPPILINAQSHQQ